jgi:hypothetical protein
MKQYVFFFVLNAYFGVISSYHQQSRKLQEFNVFKSYGNAKTRPKQYSKRIRTRHVIDEYLSPMQREMQSNRKGRDKPDNMFKNDWSGFDKLRKLDEATNNDSVNDDKDALPASLTPKTEDIKQEDDSLKIKSTDDKMGLVDNDDVIIESNSEIKVVKTGNRRVQAIPRSSPYFRFKAENNLIFGELSIIIFTFAVILYVTVFLVLLMCRKRFKLTY